MKEETRRKKAFDKPVSYKELIMWGRGQINGDVYVRTAANAIYCLTSYNSTNIGPLVITNYVVFGTRAYYCHRE